MWFWFIGICLFSILILSLIMVNVDVFNGFIKFCDMLIVI